MSIYAGLDVSDKTTHICVAGSGKSTEFERPVATNHSPSIT